MTNRSLPDDIDVELDQLAAQPLRVEAVDPETGERVEGVIFHLRRRAVGWAAPVEHGELRASTRG